MEDICGIYKILDKTTEKIYIGQSKHCKKRFKEHCSSNKTLIDRTINEKGQDNFEFSILKVCHDIRELDYWESYFIDKLKSLSPKGYNEQYKPINSCKESLDFYKNRELDSIYFNNCSNFFYEESAIPDSRMCGHCEFLFSDVYHNHIFEDVAIFLKILPVYEPFSLKNLRDFIQKREEKEVKIEDEFLILMLEMLIGENQCYCYTYEFDDWLKIILMFKTPSKEENYELQ